MKAVNKPIVSLITRLFDAACINQFESMGCEIREVENPSTSFEVMSAFIQAQSSDLQLGLLLKTSRLLLVQTMPLLDMESINDPSYQEDWNLELSNRFLGRLKNKLLPYGCRLNIGLPIVPDENLVLELQGNSQSIIRLFEVSSDITNSVIECYLFVKMLGDDVQSINLDAIDAVADADEGVLDEL